MVSLYEVVIAVILLFPWSLVITVAVGALWTKASTCGRPRFIREPRAGRVEVTPLAGRAGNRLDTVQPLI
jgi:hypothetical protein